MRIYRSVEEVPANFGPCALTIGNFDGVHVGHRAILELLTSFAGSHRLKPSALTFDPHPTQIVAPARAPKLMMTPAERCCRMGDAGIEQALILPFDVETASWTPEQFADRILQSALGASTIFVGDNFRFGHRQSGDVGVLRELGRSRGFTVEAVPAVTLDGTVVSSSAIRTAIEAGALRPARRMLGRPFALSGSVVSGHGIGSKQAVPTLNLAPDSQLMPASGVYVTRTTELDGGRRWPSVSNAGTRPTFDGDTFVIETFLLSELKGDSPRRIQVEFLHRLRDERKFPSPAELKQQILRDAAHASRLHQKLEWKRSL